MAKGDIPNTNTSASANSIGQKMQPTGNMAPWMQTANSGSSYPMGQNQQQPMGNMMNQPRFMIGHGMSPSPSMIQQLFGSMHQAGMQGGGMGSQTAYGNMGSGVGYQAPQQQQQYQQSQGLLSGMGQGSQQPIVQNLRNGSTQPLPNNLGLARISNPGMMQ